MGLALLMQGAATAASVGMGCGTCCGSGISVFLSGYLMTHAKDFKQSARGFAAFCLGKLLAVTLICAAASLIGAQIMDDSGRIAGIPVKAVVDAAMLAMGVWLLIGWFRERAGRHACHTCGRCGTKAERPAESADGRMRLGALMGLGAGYGASPCAPLVMMAGYAAALPLGAAIVTGALFALASTVSPALFLLVLSGVLAGKIQKEIPRCLTWFRLACYLLLIVFFSAELIELL